MKHTMRKVPIAQLTEPKDGLFQIMVDHWWAVSQDEELYFYGTDRFPFGSPQCNADKQIACGIAKDLGSSTTEAPWRYENFKEVRQIPLVYKPVDIAEYL